MKTIVFALTLTSLAAAPGIAAAQEQEEGAAPVVMTAPVTDPLARCLIENHDPDIEAPMKAFLVAALQGEKAAAQSNAMGFGMRIAQSSMESCGVDMKDLQGPGFQVSAQLYGGWVGEKIMTEAMGGLGML